VLKTYCTRTEDISALAFRSFRERSLRSSEDYGGSNGRYGMHSIPAGKMLFNGYRIFSIDWKGLEAAYVPGSGAAASAFLG
jgi:hypothetical protein